MRYVRLQMFNDKLGLCSGEMKHLEVMRKSFPLRIRGLYQESLYDITISGNGELQEVDLVGDVLPGRSCFWIPLFDKSRMEWAVEKLTELGVSLIAFYYSDHCTYNKTQIKKFAEPERLRRIENKIWAAAQQSGNLYPPKIAGVFPIKELQNEHFSGRTTIWSVHANEVINPDAIDCIKEDLESGVDAHNLMANYLKHFVIGPEGDFSLAERKLLSTLVWGRMNRDLILRTETALVVIAAQLGEQWWSSITNIRGNLCKNKIFSA